MVSMAKKNEEQQLVDFAKRALHGLEKSNVMIGVCGTEEMSRARIEFTLQVGHCLLTGKPLILAVPVGQEIPPKLEVAAEAIVRYNPEEPETMHAGLVEAFTRLGVNKM